MKAVVPVMIGLGLNLTGCGGTQTGDMSGYNSGNGSRSLDNSTVPSATSFGAATLGSKLLPLQNGRQGFVAGFNVSSFTGQPDRELGKSPLLGEAEPGYSSKLVASTMQDMAEVGSNVIRVRLFQKLNGLKLDSGGLVSGLDDAFQKNLSDLLDKAEASKMQVYICLLDSWSESAIAKNPLTDVNAKNAFLKKAITPLVAKLKGRSSVFAIDLFGEIESQISGKDGNKTDKGISWDQARAFLKSTVDVVKSVDPQRLVSASSGLHETDNVKSGKFSKLGLDFFDVHMFDDKGVLPPARELKLDRPVLIGACGQSSKTSDAELQTKTDMAFLDSAMKQGYAGAILSDFSKNGDSPLNLLDKDGKHRPALAQFQSFVALINASLPNSGTSVVK